MDFGMIETNITLRKLTADEGMVLTNGEAYGKEIYLGIYDRAENWHEITDAEYEAIMAAQMPEEGAIV